MTVTPSASSITTAQALTVTVAVSGGTGNPTATGSVTLSGGGYRCWFCCWLSSLLGQSAAGAE
jgi:hypothetical protein